jgi:hypothetical protein
MADFLDTINQWVEETEHQINETLQTIVLKVGQVLVTLSPVDTGLFRGNWQLSIDSTTSSSLLRTDPDGYATIADIASKVNSFTAGQVAYLQNHVLYGYDLEYGTYSGPTAKVTEDGFSRQAPAGIVRITEQRFLRIVNEAAALHRK